MVRSGGFLLVTIALLMVISPLRGLAQPQAPGIDERLTRLEEGQRSIEKRFDDVNKRFDDLRADMNQRFADMNQRLTDMNRGIDQRFDDLNRRMNDLITFIQILVGVLAAMAIGIFGTLLLMWRRLVKVEADVALLSSQFRLVRTP